MPRPHSRLLPTLLAAAVAVSCSGEDRPTPLTRLVIPPGARALVVVKPEHGLGTLLAVDAAGAVHRVDRVGEGLRFLVAARGWDPEDLLRNPVAGRLLPLSEDTFVLVFQGADDPRNPSWAAFVRGAAVVSRDGTLTPLLPFPHDAQDSWETPRRFRADSAGQLYFADIGFRYGHLLPGRVSPLVLVDGWLSPGWDISAVVDDVTSFAVDNAGNLAYRAVRKEGTTATPVLALRPTLGPLVTLLDDGDLGEPFRAVDGLLYVTRALGDAAGTIELLRVDFGLETVATPVASWAGAPGLLAGEPLELDGARAFVRAGEVVVVGASGTPAVHPLSFAHSAVRASAGALWFVAEDAAGAMTRDVRWLDGVADDVLPAEAYDVEEVAPYDDAAALVGAIRRSDGERLILRAMVGGAAEPVDVGITQPVLADGLLLR